MFTGNVQAIPTPLLFVILDGGGSPILPNTLITDTGIVITTDTGEAIITG